MKHRGSVGFRLLATALIFITAGCMPGKSLAGATLQIPAVGVPAWQIKSDRSGHDNCQIGGGQQARVTRETYWSPNTGASGDNLSTDLVEIDVTNPGSCDSIRPIFLTRKTASKLDKEIASTSPEGGRSPGQTK